MTLITLPRSVIKEMNDEYIKIELLEDIIPKKRINKDVLKNARGMGKIMNQFLLDTNVIIYFFNNESKAISFFNKISEMDSKNY